MEALGLQSTFHILRGNTPKIHLPSKKFLKERRKWISLAQHLSMPYILPSNATSGSHGFSNSGQTNYYQACEGFFICT